jgi:hypothetical protein
MACIEPIFTKLIITQYNVADISCTEFYLNLAKNEENSGKISVANLCKYDLH